MTSAEISQMRIGIFGGTFDPIHHGHLILARAAAEELLLDRVVFIPARISPHKTDIPGANAQDRLAMIRLAIESEPGFEANDMEIHRPSPSYTVDTLRAWKRLAPDAELYLLIGADNVAEFETWRQPDEIRCLAQIIVLDRAGCVTLPEWPVVRRLVDISSTDIRSRVAHGRSIRYLTPNAVCDYINAQSLYRNK